MKESYIPPAHRTPGESAIQKAHEYEERIAQGEVKEYTAASTDETLRAAEALIKKQNPGRYDIPEDEEPVPSTDPTPETRQREAGFRNELYTIEKEDADELLAALRAYPKSETLTAGAIKTLLLEIYGKKEEIIDGIPGPAEIPTINVSGFRDISGETIEDFVVQLKMEIMMAGNLTMESVIRISQEM